METKRIFFAATRDEEIKKLVDNSIQKQKNPQNILEEFIYVRLEKLFGGL